MSGIDPLSGAIQSDTRKLIESKLNTLVEDCQREVQKKDIEIKKKDLAYQNLLEKLRKVVQLNTRLTKDLTELNRQERITPQRAQAQKEQLFNVPSRKRKQQVLQENNNSFVNSLHKQLRYGC